MRNMKPDVRWISRKSIGFAILSGVLLTGCQLGRPQFSTGSTISLTAAEVDSRESGNSEAAIRPAVAERRRSPATPSPRRDAESNRGSRSSIQLVSWVPDELPAESPGDLFDSGTEPWLSRPPRLVSAESENPSGAEPEVADSPIFEPASDPLTADEAPLDLESGRIRFRDDACDLLPMLRDDVCSLVTWKNAIIIGAGVGGAIAIRESLDGNVRDYTLRHRQLWGEGSQVMRQFGEFSWQVPVIAGVYGWSVWSQDEKCHEFSKALISAYAITSITTVTIKGIADTKRPTTQFQNGEYGFPSFHTASTFSIAAVIDEYYGWPAGVPAYVMAGLVGWSRIDQREHDLSDVLFGSLLGFVIGKTIASAHLDRHGNTEILPYYDPASSTVGALFHWRF